MELGRYSEETKIIGDWINYIIIIAIIISIIFIAFPIEIASYHNSIKLTVILLILGLSKLLYGKMITTIQNDNIIVYFGYFGWIKRKISLQNIEHSEIVEYNPIKQFGGWGIRISKFKDKKTLQLALAGKKGILIVLKKPIKIFFTKVEQILIGSYQPKKLHEIITKY